MKALPTATLPVKVTFKAAKHDHLSGVRTFYLSSLSGGSDTYTLKVIRREGLRRPAFTCTCQDFTHRARPLNVTCKHIRVLKGIIEAMGGLSKIPTGYEVSILRQTERNAAAGSTEADADMRVAGKGDDV